MTDEELKKLCDQIISEPKLYRDAVHVARALRERLDRTEVTPDAVFQRIEQLIDTLPQDGLNAEGVYNDTVADRQRAYVNGLRQARVSVMALFQRGEG